MTLLTKRLPFYLQFLLFPALFIAQLAFTLSLTGFEFFETHFANTFYSLYTLNDPAWVDFNESESGDKKIFLFRIGVPTVPSFSMAGVELKLDPV